MLMLWSCTTSKVTLPHMRRRCAVMDMKSSAAQTELMQHPFAEIVRLICKKPAGYVRPTLHGVKSLVME